MKEAMLYRALDDGRVECQLCAHRCVIRDGQWGICRVRQNRGGTLYTVVYGQTIARHVDPVEKKPLFHFFPGSRAYSVATPGCNFRCQWCQNWDISQMPRQQGLAVSRNVAPAEIVEDALRTSCQSIAYTYTEPTIFFEYAHDIAEMADAQGIHNVIVTNGYMTREMLENFRPRLDAANVDLKSFRDETYRKYVGGRLKPVLENMKLMKDMGVWLEVTMLVIPGLNDDQNELREAAEFIAHELGPQVPWHISRFHPAGQMNDTPITPRSTLEFAREIGREAGLRYVYLGNVLAGEDTHCHECGRLLVRRSGMSVLEQYVSPEGRCPSCGTAVAGVGMGSCPAPPP